MTSKNTPLRFVALLDTETTGLDPETDAVVEVAVVLYDVATACPVASFASLLFATENPAVAVNRIPVEALRAAPQPEEVWRRVKAMVGNADAVVAHNASFDRSFVPAETAAGVPWICSMSALTWPLATKAGGSLVTLALDHGLAVTHAHRALPDCDLLARLLTRCHELGHDLQALLLRGLRPQATYAAMVSYDDRAKAKDAGFLWNGATKLWTRTMAREDAVGLAFPVREIES